ncbi:MAG: ATP-binding cassette domain-containing protein [Clostridia bacterium]|nr:ATP-binding cassette domain-containing protein [Clostridia bacterium]
MKILIGTTNPSKLTYYSGILKDYQVECICLNDLGIDFDPEETGNTPVENSQIKAKFYGQYFDVVVCNDAGLYIEDIPFEDPRQPALKVRSPKGYRFNDEEMIEYYSELVNSLGGKVSCYYLDGVSIYNKGEFFNFTATECKRKFYMVGTPSEKRHEGWPLDSISQSITTGKYFVDEKDPIKSNNKSFDTELREFIVKSLNLQKKEELNNLQDEKQVENNVNNLQNEEQVQNKMEENVNQEPREEILKCQNLRKSFVLSTKQRKLEKTDLKVKVAVDDLSFSAYKGEIFGLLGPNGAGKTTTLRMLATLIKPDSGDAFVDNVSIKSDPYGVRQKIGFLTSELKLEDFFTPNYLYDFFSNLYNLPQEVSQKRKKELFEKFGIDKFAEVKVANLSTGMKQKVSIVISIVHDPSIIIFDEPTNGLDVLTAKVVTDFLLELKEKGKTIILSTHIFSLVEKICDRVGVIIDGKLVCCDSVKAITKQKGLEDVFFDLYKQVKEEE